MTAVVPPRCWTPSTARTTVPEHKIVETLIEEALRHAEKSEEEAS